MQENPTVTAAEIARLAGVGRAAVSNWRKRHADFPAPTGGTPASPEFDLTQVETWLREQGKLPQLAAADKLWQQLLAAGENPSAALAEIGATLLARKRNAPLPTGDPDLAPLLSSVDELAAESGPEAAFDELWQRYERLPARRTASTPDELADLMAGLAGVDGASVLDPTCGAGGILRAAVRAGADAVHGQEIDPDQARLAELWLALRDAPGEVQAGDSFRADAYADRTVDVVLTHPPFGATRWGQEEIGFDPRWEYGPPPRTEPELAWAQHALAHLRPEGRAVLLMPPAVASRRAGRRIRAELLRRGALRAVIALPARAAAPHGVPLHLWVLRRPAPDGPAPSQVLLIDAAAGDGALTSTYATILALFRRFADAPDEPIEEPGLARAVPVIELLDDEVDLTPARRHPTASVDDTAAQLTGARDRLAALLDRLPTLLPSVAPDPAATGTPPTVSISELVRAGALRLVSPIRGGDQETTVAAGDVLVPVLARQLDARVVTEDGAPLGRNLHLLRPNPAALDPWFLAGQLRTSANQRQASSLSGTLRFDVRRAQIVRLPLAEQRRLGEAYRRWDAFAGTLAEAATLGGDLTRMVADGLAAGTLRPGDDPTPHAE